MATVKAVLRKKQNPQGHYPIAIRITKDRKSSYLGTGQHIEEKYWDEKIGVLENHIQMQVSSITL